MKTLYTMIWSENLLVHRNFTKIFTIKTLEIHEILRNSLSKFSNMLIIT